MAEFCLKFFNKLNGTSYKASQVWLEEDFCEGCADWQLCVVTLRHKPLFQRLKDIINKVKDDGIAIWLDDHTP